MHPKLVQLEQLRQLASMCSVKPTLSVASFSITLLQWYVLLLPHSSQGRKSFLHKPLPAVSQQDS